MTERRRLIVMRHARAEPYAATDHERRLTDRGVAEAAAAGARLSARGFVPDHAVVSTAERARMTWREVERETGSGEVARHDAAVYSGSVEVALEALRCLPAEVRTAAFVGHNPTAAYLCHLLDDGEGDPGSVDGLLRGFPAGALAVFELAVSWEELGAETGRVVDFWAPGS